MAGTVLGADGLPPQPILHRPKGVVRLEAALTCDASGVITAAVMGVGYGVLKQVLYNGGLDASATITIADAKTGAAIVTYVTGTEGTPVAFQPTTAIVDNAGALVVAANTAPNVNRPIEVSGKITVAVTAGGVSETAILALVIDEAGLGDGAPRTV